MRNLGTIFLVNIVVLCFLTLGFGREYLRNLEIERNIRQLEEEHATLEGEQLAALSVISSLSSEYYLEGEARKKRGLAKPGEQLVLVDDTAAAASAADDASAAAAAVGNPARWFYYFFDHKRFEELRAL